MNRALKLSAVFLFFLAISAVYTSPLYRHINTGFTYTQYPAAGNEVIPFTEGDPVQLYYHFWMAWDYARGGPGPFWRDPYEFRDGEEGIFTTRRLWISLLYVLLCPFGTVFAYNALILLCLALAGFSAYFLARHYTGRDGPSIVAGLLYGFFPFALGQILGGHTNGFLLFLIPLCLYFIEKGLSTGKSVFMFLTALTFSCFAFIEYHLLYYIFLLMPPFFLVRSAMVRPGWKKFICHSLTLAISAGMALAIMFAIRHFEIAGSAQAAGRELKEIFLYSPSWSDFFQRVNPNVEKNIYLSFFALAAAAIGFIFSGWRRGLFWLYGAFFGVFAILSLGISSQKLDCLYLFMYERLPYFSLSRLPGRMVVFAVLALAILAAMGLSRFKKSGLLSLACLVGIGAEFFPRTPAGVMLLPPKSKVYEEVAKNIGDQKLLCLPIWPGDSSWSSIYLYYVTQTRVPIVNGYYPIVPKNYIEGVFYPLYSMNVGEVRPEQVELLRRLNVKYVVFHEEAFPGKVSHFPARVSVENLKQSPHLRLTMHDGKQWLFELLPQAEPREPKFTSSPIGIYLAGKKLKDSAGFYVDHRIQVLPPGEYVAQFQMSGTGDVANPIRLLGQDPMDRKEGKYAAAKILAEKKGARENLFLPFQLDKAQLVTIQVDRPADPSWKIDWVLITQKGSQKLPATLEAEDLFTHGEIVEDAQASGGMAVCGMPEAVQATELCYGPYRRFAPGKYTLRFFVKPVMNPDKAKPLCADLLTGYLEVTQDYGKKVLASRPLRAENLVQEESYHAVELSFFLEEEQVLEFRIPFLRQMGFCIDRIEIEKQS